MIVREGYRVAKLQVYSACVFPASKGVLYFTGPSFLTYGAGCLCLALGQGRLVALAHPLWTSNFLQNSRALVLPLKPAVFFKLLLCASVLPLQT